MSDWHRSSREVRGGGSSRGQGSEFDPDRARRHDDRRRDDPDRARRHDDRRRDDPDRARRHDDRRRDDPDRESSRRRVAFHVTEDGRRGASYRRNGDHVRVDEGRDGGPPNVYVETADRTRVTSTDSASERYDRETTLTTPYGRVSMSAAGPGQVRSDVDVAPHSLSVEHRGEHDTFSYANTEEGYGGFYDTQTRTGGVVDGDHSFYASGDQFAYANRDGGYGSYDAQTRTASVGDGNHRFAVSDDQVSYANTYGGYGSYNMETGRLTVGEGDQRQTFSSEEVADAVVHEGTRVVRSFVRESIRRFRD